MKKSDFLKEIKNIKNYDFSEFVYVNNYTKSIVYCKKHKIKLNKNLKQIRRGSICSICSSKINSTNKFIEKSKEIWGNDKWDYSKTTYVNSRTLLEISCPMHNLNYNVYPSQHLKKQKDCPKCINEINKNEFIKKSKEIWGNDKWDYSNVKYENNKTYVEIICKSHGSFKQRPDNHLFNKNGCPKCNQSKGELIISNFLNDKDIEYEYQKSFNGCRYKYILRFDFYLPKYNICIEFNGEQHYEPVKYFGGLENLKYNEKKDKIKRKYCENNKINLISIKYDDNLNKKLKLILKSIYNI